MDDAQNPTLVERSRSVRPARRRRSDPLGPSRRISVPGHCSDGRTYRVPLVRLSSNVQSAADTRTPGRAGWSAGSSRVRETAAGPCRIAVRSLSTDLGNTRFASRDAMRQRSLERDRPDWEWSATEHPLVSIGNRTIRVGGTDGRKSAVLIAEPMNNSIYDMLHLLVKRGFRTHSEVSEYLTIAVKTGRFDSPISYMYNIMIRNKQYIPVEYKVPKN